MPPDPPTLLGASASYSFLPKPKILDRTLIAVHLYWLGICAHQLTCVRGPAVEKELLDLLCEDGAWSVAAFNEDPDTEFDIETRTDCSSCVNSTEIETYDAITHCVGEDTVCNM